MGNAILGTVQGWKNTFGRCLKFVTKIIQVLTNYQKTKKFLAEVVDMANFEMQRTRVNFVKQASIKTLMTTITRSQTGSRNARNAQQAITRPKFLISIISKACLSRSSQFVRKQTISAVLKIVISFQNGT